MDTVGWVYFVREADRGRYKIGRAANVEKRLKQLQTGCSEELIVAGVLPCVDPGTLERACHAAFAGHMRRGEWFEPCQDIEDFLEFFAYDLGGRISIRDELYGE